jgi:hypothetical protein
MSPAPAAGAAAGIKPTNSKGRILRAAASLPEDFLLICFSTLPNPFSKTIDAFEWNSSTPFFILKKMELFEEPMRLHLHKSWRQSARHTKY